MCSGGGVRAAASGRMVIRRRRADDASAPRRPPQPYGPRLPPECRCYDDTVQQDQPAGVPPLALTGERTLPDVPEENYWYRRHLAVYEWIARARAPGSGSPTSPAARATAPMCWPRRPPRWSGSTPTRRPTSTPGCATGARTSASSAASSRRFAEPRDAIVFLQTIEHVERPGRAARPLRRVARRRLRLDPEPPHPRPSGGREVRQPLAPARVHGRRVPRPAGAALLRVRCSALFHARKLRVHELALRAGWDRVHPALRAHEARSTTASSRRSRPRTSCCATTADLDRALDFVAVCHALTRTRRLRRPRAGRPAQPVGDLAIVLHTHMPYVEGFGTYPFGEEWLFDAVSAPTCRFCEVAGDLTMTVTPVLADQLEAAGGRRAVASFLAASGSRRAGATRPRCPASCRPAARVRGRALRARAGAPRRARRRPGGGVRRRPRGPAWRCCVLGGDPRGAAAARHPAGTAAAARRRPALAPAPLRAAGRASGSPSAPTSPASRRCWRSAAWPTSAPTRAPRARRSTRLPRIATAPARSPSRSTGRRSSGSGPWRAIHRTPSTPTSTASRCAATRRGRSAAGRTTRRRRARARRARGEFVRGDRRAGWRPFRATAGGPG